MIFQGGKNNIKKWNTLQHNGVMFSIYTPHNIPIVIKNKEIILPPSIEEYATIYAKYIDSDYNKQPQFKKNFWKDFKPMISKMIDLNTQLSDISFDMIYNYIISMNEKKKLLTKEEKEKIKKDKEIEEEKYKYCTIDDNKILISNFHIEPPGIFLGRGSNHPLLGRIKKRIYPEDITLNLSKDAPIPIPNIGGKWKKIVHDKEGVWIASWKDKLTEKTKYVYLSLESHFKSSSDTEKYNLAKKLKKKINYIREQYISQLTDVDNKIKQLATSLYFIDNLALRVGNKKNTKKSSDTVGVSSLRVEHILLLPDNQIKLDFLGKDCVRYIKKIKVLPEVYNNLELFTKNKSKKELIFNLINPIQINDYLTSFMPNLTSKVWRTFNASYVFQKELDKVKEDMIKNMTNSEKINYLVGIFYQANAQVALLCNHQKKISATCNSTLSNMENKIKELKLKKKKYIEEKKNTKPLDQKIKELKFKLETKTKMKNVALNTSKDNYIDPRIIFAFIKKFDVSPEKFFSKKSLSRFYWASSIDSNYRF